MTKRMIEWEMVKEEIAPQEPTPKRNSLPWMISQLALPHLNALSLWYLQVTLIHNKCISSCFTTCNSYQNSNQNLTSKNRNTEPYTNPQSIIN